MVMENGENLQKTPQTHMKEITLKTKSMDKVSIPGHQVINTKENIKMTKDMVLER